MIQLSVTDGMHVTDVTGVPLLYYLYSSLNCFSDTDHVTSQPRPSGGNRGIRSGCHGNQGPNESPQTCYVTTPITAVLPCPVAIGRGQDVIEIWFTKLCCGTLKFCGVVYKQSRPLVPKFKLIEKKCKKSCKNIKKIKSSKINLVLKQRFLIFVMEFSFFFFFHLPV